MLCLQNSKNNSKSINKYSTYSTTEIIRKSQIKGTIIRCTSVTSRDHAYNMISTKRGMTIQY